MTAHASPLTLNLADLLIGRRPDQACIGCNHTRFILSSGMPDLAHGRLEDEIALMRAALGADGAAWAEDETFEALVHVMRCQRCGHEETVFLPPINPPLIGGEEVTIAEAGTALETG